MSATNNKVISERVWQEVWHQESPKVMDERIDELFAPDFVRHDPGREIHGPDENRQFIESFRAAFPDLRFTALDHIAEGDRVAVRYRFEGTHLGEFRGIPPTRKQVSYSGILIYRIADGKIAEQWTEFDLFGFLKQLGALRSGA